MSFGILSCLFGKHDPDRHNVHDDGFDWRGKCRRCGTDIKRRGHRDWIAVARSKR